jgi:TRAP transporter TAXI family solute receptor
VLVRSARAGEGEFTESGYGRIRALWPLPGLVMHWAVTEDSGIDDLRGLAGRRFIPGGAGSAGAKFTVQVFEALGLADQVELVHLDLSEAVRAVKNRRAVGLATSSSPPASIIEELAAARGLRLLSLDEEDYRRIPERFDRYVIPAGLYPGVDQPVPTITLKVALYTTADLPEDVAYDLTRAFWENRSIWETAHPAMKLLDPKGLDALGAPLHPGALRYYRQAGLWAE